MKNMTMGHMSIVPLFLTVSTNILYPWWTCSSKFHHNITTTVVHLEVRRRRMMRAKTWVMNTNRAWPWWWAHWELNSPTFSNNFYEDAIAMMNMFIKTSLPQYYDNNGGIYDDGTKRKKLLLVSRLIYSLLNRANHAGSSDGPDGFQKSFLASTSFNDYVGLRGGGWINIGLFIPYLIMHQQSRHNQTLVHRDLCGNPIWEKATNFYSFIV